MEISGWYVWIALGLAVFQALGIVLLFRRMRGTDPVVRSQARFDLLEAVGGLLLLGGLSLSLLVAGAWFGLTLAGIVLLAAVYAVKGVRLLRARRRSASRS
ncbi:hypothetical protein [Streptomyces laurentii]|uniref:hypothetical protein n=1 Tax=Streptomyces laurentii TaxID=39478 RepID=UPI00340075BD